MRKHSALPDLGLNLSWTWLRGQTCGAPQEPTLCLPWRIRVNYYLHQSCSKHRNILCAEHPSTSLTVVTQASCPLHTSRTHCHKTQLRDAFPNLVLRRRKHHNPCLQPHLLGQTRKPVTRLQNKSQESDERKWCGSDAFAADWTGQATTIAGLHTFFHPRIRPCQILRRANHLQAAEE